MPSYTTSSTSYTSMTTTKNSEGTTSRSLGQPALDLMEFFSPAPISMTGNYWPRYSNCDKSVPQTGSAYITYLARPYLNYKTPSTYASKYGHSKYINIRKL